MARRRREPRHEFRRYVPVAQRRAAAARAAAESSTAFDPVWAEGRRIAHTVWGRAWCDHIESFHDYSNRLPRGRTYVRNGSVVDLQITEGAIDAQVMGSELYQQTVRIAPCPPKRWNKLAARCAGGIGSLIELLEGRLSDAVMAAITDPAAGLLPDLRQVELSCSCPDWASLCKHLAAVLYGVGARLDQRPDLLFTLRGVSPDALIAKAAPVVPSAPAGRDPNLDPDLEVVFGIAIDWGGDAPRKPAAKAKPRKRAPTSVTRAELLDLGVPPGTIATWLRAEVLVATKTRGVYRHTAASRARLRDRKA